MTEQQKDFVHMYLKYRDKIVAHNLAYGNNPNYDSVESSANRLLRIPEIADTIRSIQDNIRHEVEEEFKAKYREELLSIYDKRMLLKRIATGELYVEQKYKGKNCTQCSQYISPTINQMLAAIREDNKLAGHHPHKVNGNWVIPALQTEQEENSNNLEKDNNLAERLNEANEKDINNRIKGQQLNETIIDNQPLTVEQENTTETPLLFLGGDIGASASGGDKRQSGRLTREEQETQDEKENKGQQTEKTDIDNQPFTETQEPHDTPLSIHSISAGGTINPSGNIISQEKLRELLYPQKPKLSYMKNNP